MTIKVQFCIIKWFWSNYNVVFTCMLTSIRFLIGDSYVLSGDLKKQQSFFHNWKSSSNDNVKLYQLFSEIVNQNFSSNFLRRWRTPPELTREWIKKVPALLTPQINVYWIYENFGNLFSSAKSSTLVPQSVKPVNYCRHLKYLHDLWPRAATQRASKNYGPEFTTVHEVSDHLDIGACKGRLCVQQQWHLIQTKCT